MSKQGEQELLGNTGIRWSSASIVKAERLVEDGKVHRDPEHDDVFKVEGSKTYRVQTDGKNWASCSCPNGQRTSRPNCYHLAAALMVMLDEQNAKVHYVGEGAGERCFSAMVEWDADDPQRGICFEHDRRVKRVNP